MLLLIQKRHIKVEQRKVRDLLNGHWKKKLENKPLWKKKCGKTGEWNSSDDQENNKL